MQRVRHVSAAAHGVGGLWCPAVAGSRGCLLRLSLLQSRMLMIVTYPSTAQCGQLWRQNSSWLQHSNLMMSDAQHAPLHCFHHSSKSLSKQ